MIEVKLDKKQANLILLALENLQSGLTDELREQLGDRSSREIQSDIDSCRHLWNNIMTLGLEAHFGGKQ
jgi:Ribonuclease G/E